MPEPSADRVATITTGEPARQDPTRRESVTPTTALPHPEQTARPNEYQPRNPFPEEVHAHTSPIPPDQIGASVDNPNPVNGRRYSRANYGTGSTVGQVVQGWVDTERINTPPMTQFTMIEMVDLLHKPLSA